LSLSGTRNATTHHHLRFDRTPLHTPETVSVMGTPAFMDFVESIQSNGVPVEYRPMGEGTTRKQ